ncbi:XdhC/CoxF family protein [Rhodospirillaceae bacterium KN72]|uniref:XdhC/CoxF family protein n=1 Tax=Pacificispira spongiicola TaxID=2729598 RepID=A0A7Y0DYR9_9PROT|nr:XdhC family protein [Pacificispira spongiicola]NMM44055.1 XdhC/CoxF family protein [Pacificispira spongiicola]
MKRAFLERLEAARQAKQPTVVATRLSDGAQALIVDGDVVAGDLAVTPAIADAAQTALRRDKSGTEDGVFLQIFNPPLRLIIVGAVHIAQVLAPMATLSGYGVTVIDPRGAWASAERFPDIAVIQDWPEEAMQSLAPDRRTAVVALTHDPKLDDPALAVALATDAFYVGALGSKKTAAARAVRLKDSGVSDGAIARIDGPIGMNIGAVSPAEIAVAILAKITLTLRGPKGG